MGARLGRWALVVAAVLAGCADDENTSLFIDGAILPQADEGACVLDPGGERLVRGIYNVDVDTAYHSYPVFNNQLRTRQDLTLSTEPNGILMQRAEVTLELSDGSRIEVDDQTVSGYVPPGQMNQPGQAAGHVILIPSSYREQLPKDGFAVATVRVFGRTNGGVDVESGRWSWPIELCSGACLRFCPTEADEAIVCTPGQDVAMPDRSMCMN